MLGLLQQELAEPLHDACNRSKVGHWVNQSGHFAVTALVTQDPWDANGQRSTSQVWSTIFLRFSEDNLFHFQDVQYPPGIKRGNGQSAIWTHFIDVNVDMLILHGKVFNFQSLTDGQLS